MSAYVYEVYGTDDDLIYVGSTVDLFGRLKTHMSTSWWVYLAAKVKARVFPTTAEARAEEKRTICARHPRFNVKHLPNRALWSPAQYEDCALALGRGRRDHHGAGHLLIEYRNRFGRDMPPLVPAAARAA